tara:strand:- start:945 stop:1214 length:270 start_codon:yes stop_codon:yes gene_type:complete
MNEIDAIWNGVLTIAIGSFMWWIKSQKAEFQNVYDMIGSDRKRNADHREEVAKIYLTKAEADADRREIMQRFDKIEEKLDAILLNSRGT